MANVSTAKTTQISFKTGRLRFSAFDPVAPTHPFYLTIDKQFVQRPDVAEDLSLLSDLMKRDIVAVCFP